MTKQQQQVDVVCVPLAILEASSTAKHSLASNAAKVLQHWTVHLHPLVCYIVIM